jgi:hypothetical protein
MLSLRKTITFLCKRRSVCVNNIGRRHLLAKPGLQRTGLFSVLLASLFIVQANAETIDKEATLFARVQAEGQIRVVVNLDSPEIMSGKSLYEITDEELVGLVARSQDAVLSRLQEKNPGLHNITKFRYSAQLALSVTESGLRALIRDPGVVDISEDAFVEGAVGRSVPLIFPGFQDSAFSGAGWAIAVLDTGVDKFHPAFGSRVVKEACYSSNEGFSNYYSLCPGSTLDNPIAQSTDTGSGVDCQAQLDNLKSMLGVQNSGGTGCSHGTGVAGVAAGNFGDSQGVAVDADIIAIQVYTASHSDNQTPDDLSDDTLSVGAFTSDLVKGLERVYALKDSDRIAAVNISLGGLDMSLNALDEPSRNAIGTQAECNSALDPNLRGYSATLRPIIQRLKQAGIATVVASGNNDVEDGVGAYACIEEVIAVGATDLDDQKYDVCDHDLQLLVHESPATAFNASNPSIFDTRNCGSNSGELLDFWAPGVSIETARAASAGGGTEVNSGTSEAAPHVAGAWAVMKQRKPNASVDEIEAAFDATGKPITVAGVTRKRINIAEALLELTDDPIDDNNQIPVALTPTGTIDTNQPTFTWSAVAGADTYAVYAVDAAGERKVWNLVGAANAGCESGTGTCSYTHSSAVFAEGEGGFWNVRTAHDQQHGIESNSLGFSVETTDTPVTPISSLEDTCQQGKAPFGNETLTAGESVCLEDASNGGQRQMEIYVSDDQVGSTLEIVMGHGSGDANLLHRFDNRPTREQYDQISESSGNEEKLIINHLSRGWHYIHVRANSEFSGVTLRASFQ